jgi:hypothetical protein
VTGLKADAKVAAASLGGNVYGSPAPGRVMGFSRLGCASSP